MVCPECGQVNDPSSLACARCDTALHPSAGSAGPRQYADQPPAAPRYEQPASAFTPLPPLPPLSPPPPLPPPNGNLPGRSRLPLIAGLSVLLLIVLVAATVIFRQQIWRSDAASARPVPTPAGATGTLTAEPAPQPVGDPRAQAAAIDAVLSDSVASRRKLNDAIERIGGCDDLNSAVADMQAVGTERQSQIGTVQAADLSALPTGESLRSGLIAALRYALKADQGFLGWAEPTPADGCATTSGRDRAYAAGQNASTQAGAAKRAFLAQWNPVATENGLDSRSADDI